MKAYSKKLLLACLIVTPYAFTGEGMHEQGTPDNIQTLIQNAEQKVAEANGVVDEVEASLAEANQLRFTLQVMTDEILQTPLDHLTRSIGVIETLLDRTAQLLTSQSEILRILNKQLPYLPQIEQAATLVHDHQQRIRAHADDQSVQNIERLLQQLLTHKNTIEEAIQDTKEYAQQTVGKTIESITKIRQAVEQLAGQPDLPGQERQALAITTQIITSLLEIEQSIQTLLERNLYREALQGARKAQNVHNALLPITPGDIPAMQNRAQQAQIAAGQVTVPPIVPAYGGPAGTPATAGQPRPGERPRAPDAPPTPPTVPPQRTPPPVGPPGRALENINKVNSKLESALQRLNNVTGYFNQVDAAERAVIKKQVTGIFNEYKGLSEFAARFRRVKAGNGQLDQAKLAPFDKFLELINKLSAKVKSL